MQGRPFLVIVPWILVQKAEVYRNFGSPLLYARGDIVTYGSVLLSFTTRLSSTETGHDRLPQVDAKGLDFNELFQGHLARFSSSQSVAHSAPLDICLPKNLQN